MAPAVPDEIYPVLIVGVTFLEALTVALITPAELIEIEGLAVIEVAGVLALPALILLLAVVEKYPFGTYTVLPLEPKLLEVFVTILPVILLPFT